VVVFAGRRVLLLANFVSAIAKLLRVSSGSRHRS
jgi:hypothetical protein